MFSKKFPVEEAVLVLIIFVFNVEDLPFTFEVIDILFVVVEIEMLFVVVAIEILSIVLVEMFDPLLVVVAMIFPFASTASIVLFSPVSVVLADVN